MAIKDNTEVKPVMKNGQRQADAWGNVILTDKNGNEHNLGGIPLHAGHPLSDALIAKGTVGQSVKLDVKLSLSLHVVDHAPKAIDL